MFELDPKNQVHNHWLHCEFTYLQEEKRQELAYCYGLVLLTKVNNPIKKPQTRIKANFKGTSKRQMLQIRVALDKHRLKGK